MLFQSVSESVSAKKQSDLIDNPIMYKNYDNDSLKLADIIFIVEKPYSDKEIKQISSFLYSSITRYKKDFKYAIVSSIYVKIQAPVKTKVTDFYIENSTNLEEIIPKGSKIISLGRAIYSITKSNDLQESDFIDTITHKNHFYSPDLESYIFPTYEMYRWFGKDNFEIKWCITQITDCLEFKPRRAGRRENIRHDVVHTSKFFKDFANEKIMSIDTETDGLDWRTNNIGCVTMAFNSREGYFLRWKDIDVKEFADFIRNKKQIYQNGKFDCKSLITSGVDRDALHIDYDLWNMQHVWKEDNSRASLKHGAWRFTRYGGYDRPLDEYKKNHKVKNYLDIPEEVMIPYAVDDAIETFEIFEELKKTIEYMDKKYPLTNGWSTWRYFEEVVMGSVNTFLDVELAGLHINREELQMMEDELTSKIESVENRLYKAFNLKKDEAVDFKNPNHLGKLVESLGWRIDDRGKNKLPNTNEDCLLRWKKQGHSEVDLILELRGLLALSNTFVGRSADKSGFQQHMRDEDGITKIYPRMNPMLAGSGRTKHFDPNTANIPSHGEGAKFVRRMFCPPNKDYCFLSADASGLQLRIIAILSEDKVMRDIFVNRGGDMHSMTGFNVFGRNLKVNDQTKDIIKDVGQKIDSAYRKLELEDFFKYKKSNSLIASLRFKSKGVNFGLSFGAQVYTVKTTVIDKDWTDEEVITFVREMKLEDSYKKHLERLKDKGKTDTSELEITAKKLAVAEYIRVNFFKTYKGIKRWIEETREQAKRDGFVRSIYGAWRRLPYLKYKGNDTDNALYANLLNICLNSPVQNVESVLMNIMMTEVNRYIKENKCLSYFIGAVHDAIEKILHKDEKDVLCSYIKEVFERDRPEFEGIPFEMEGNVADYWGTYRTDKWELWDLGHDWETYLNH